MLKQYCRMFDLQYLHRPLNLTSIFLWLADNIQNLNLSYISGNKKNNFVYCIEVHKSKDSVWILCLGKGRWHNKWPGASKMVHIVGTTLSMTSTTLWLKSKSWTINAPLRFPIDFQSRKKYKLIGLVHVLLVVNEENSLVYFELWNFCASAKRTSWMCLIVQSTFT